MSAPEILAAERALGLELTDWQRSMAQRILEAQAIVAWPQRGGKTAVLKVVKHIRGARADLVVYDEVQP